jgi:urease accessory protein
MDWTLWQIADSAFPTGGFAHSFGLEAAWQHGAVDATTLASFVHDALGQAGHGALPFVSAGHAAVGRAPRLDSGRASSAPTPAPAKPAPATLAAVDARCDAFLLNVVANRASRTQGRAWLATFERTFPKPAVRAFCAEARLAPARHYAPLVGAGLRAIDVSLDAAQRLFLFSVCRGTLSAAVRLGLAGTTDSQRLLAECAGDLDRTLTVCGGLSMDDAAQVAPLLDLYQSAHDRLYSRLFQS